MITKRLLLTFLALFNIGLFANADDEFDFYTENIDANQLKTVEFLRPDLRSKGTEPGISTYTIKIGNDGIIRSITRTSTIPYFSKNDISVSIFRKGNLINIKSSEEKTSVDNIKWDSDNIYVRGGVLGSYRSTTNDFTRIKILPERDIIYETPIIKLQKNSNNSMKEINQRGGMALSYSSNVTEGYYSDNLDWKIEYTRLPNEIMAVYYDMGGTIKYSPAWIKTSGVTSFYSGSQLINVINCLILQSIPGDLDNFLFPLVFLESPFLLNQWNYNASSYLKERNAEYSPNNLASQDGLPWASANGYGIGDKITIAMGTSPRNSLTIINGYVSTKNSSLFTANSRVKQVKLTNLNNGKSMIKTIEDSTKPQNIDISDLSPVQDTRLEIEILSVYQGSKYRDLCIQSIF
jgi:hypothetical protein